MRRREIASRRGRDREGDLLDAFLAHQIQRVNYHAVGCLGVAGDVHRDTGVGAEII